MKKVFISPTLSGEENGQGGIRRVVENQNKYLSSYGWQVVTNLEDADVINCHAAEITTYKDTPIVLSTHGLYWQGYEFGKWAKKANRKIINHLRQAEVVTAPSEFVAHSLQRGTLVDPVVVYHGINPKEWRYSGERDDYAIWAKNRVDSICDPNPATELALRFPDINVVTTFSESGNRFNLRTTGRLSYAEIKPLIQKASIYLATVMETGGITVMEAMAAGVIPVGYRHGVNPEIIQHGYNGWLVEPDDIEGLQEGIVTVLQNEAYYRSNAIDTAHKYFDIKQNIAGYVEAFEKALDKGQKPKVSVVITAYDLEQYLPDAIDSVVDQTLEDWELIVVDDNSPDNTEEVVKQYTDPRIKYIKLNSNVYLAEARNVGFRQSKGRYLIPLDADDALYLNALELLSNYLDSNPEVHIATGKMGVYESDQETLISEKPDYVSGWPARDVSLQKQLSRHNQIPYCSMYRRWVWEDTGGYRKRWKTAEDASFWARVMSYGAKAELATEAPVLKYRIRSNSMSHSHAVPNWLEWITWANDETLLPYAVQSENVLTYEPDLYIVVACGPNHKKYLQDCLDSIVAQTYQTWKIVVVNDTGDSWDSIEGFPFVDVVVTEGGKGPSYARNRGIEQIPEHIEKVIFFDADDYMNPLFLEFLSAAYEERQSWVYTDWYDQKGEYKKGKSWDFDGLMTKMLGPLSGIYPLKAVREVGGFDESLTSWEDWDLQLSLASLGYCGTRMMYGGFTYRYHTGTQRELGYAQKSDLIEYLKQKHKDIYTGGSNMACRSCGGKETNTMRITHVDAVSESEVTLVEFTGTTTNERMLRGPSTRFQYFYSANSAKLYVHNDDLEIFERRHDFVIKPREKVPTEANEEDLPTLSVQRDPVDPQVEGTPIETLELPADTESILKNNGFDYVEDILDSTGDINVSAVLSVKGIGDGRLNQIRKSL